MVYLKWVSIRREKDKWSYEMHYRDSDHPNRADPTHTGIRNTFREAMDVVLKTYTEWRSVEDIVGKGG